MRLRRTRRTFATELAAAALLLIAAPRVGAQPLGPRDGGGLPPTDTGRVTVGAAAPDFVLESKDGDRVMLSQFRGARDVVLVFYRGHW